MRVAIRSSRTGDRIYCVRVALCLEEESCPTLTLAFILCHVRCYKNRAPYVHAWQ